MRTIAMARACFDAMCERVLSRRTQGQLLSDKQMVQEKIADSWVEIEQFRLLVLRTAWLIDKPDDYKLVLKDIAAVKAAMPKCCTMWRAALPFARLDRPVARNAFARR